MNNIVMDKEVLSYDMVVNDLDHTIYQITEGVVVTINIDKFKFNKIEFNLDKNSKLIINKYYKEECVDEEITINLNGINSEVNYNFSTLSYYSQKYVININHNAKNTISNVINHGVSMNDSKILFEVNSTVKKGNKGSILNQENKIMTMGENNSIIHPNLFIDEFDVNAYHSASIGKFRREDIFYLMTKGIKESDAIFLLIKGFLEGHIRR